MVRTAWPLARRINGLAHVKVTQFIARTVSMDLYSLVRSEILLAGGLMLAGHFRESRRVAANRRTARTLQRGSAMRKTPREATVNSVKARIVLIARACCRS